MASTAIKGKNQMISEYEEIEISFIEQSKDLNKYTKLIQSLDDNSLEIELEMLEWQIRGCAPSLEESLMTLKNIVLAEINKRKKTNENKTRNRNFI